MHLHKSHVQTSQDFLTYLKAFTQATLYISN